MDGMIVQHCFNLIHGVVEKSCVDNCGQPFFIFGFFFYHDAKLRVATIINTNDRDLLFKTGLKCLQFVIWYEILPNFIHLDRFFDTETFYLISDY